ncbi:MAG TPA: hypothetical protein VF092_09465 [Longimicrobium sp.]
MPRAAVIAALACALGTACAGGDTEDASPPRAQAPPPAAAAHDADPQEDSGSSTSQRNDELERAARDVVGFLRGEVAFERLRLADTVTLYLAPESGGGSARRAREELRDLSRWRVHTGDPGITYLFIPPERLTKLTTRVGRHLDCREYPLASRFPALARLPHVGTMLEPHMPESCLATWNLTLVFAARPGPPTLVAAVFDQWEW